MLDHIYIHDSAILYRTANGIRFVLQYNKCLIDVAKEHHQKLFSVFDVKWFACHHSMASSAAVNEGDGLGIWRVATLLWTANKQWSTTLGAGQETENYSLYKEMVLQNVT
jgi:hypothetical protein